MQKRNLNFETSNNRLHTGEIGKRRMDSPSKRPRTTPEVISPSAFMVPSAVLHLLSNFLLPSHPFFYFA
jgi:hypothetical protein